jgi:hypothetical protein
MEHPRRLVLAALVLLAFPFLFLRPDSRARLRAELARLPARIRAATLTRGHSHNDYEQERPLEDALVNGFSSVEADIWIHDGLLQVSHLGLLYRGTLEELYLAPLQRRVDRFGSVYGDGRPFLLWLDIKDGSKRLPGELQRLLARYPMFTRFGGEGGERPGPVTAVLTGDPIKSAYVDGFPERYACRDGLGFDPSDPPASSDDSWCWYAISWGDLVSWGGDGPIPAAEHEKLERVVRGVHSKGRRLRIFGAPDNPAVWAEELRTGVDLVGTDRLPAAANWLGAHGG